GTGYQYGDTDFIEYDERLYLEFFRQLRSGTGPVSVGQALMAAKRKYLTDTPLPRQIHEKAVLEATLFGLPMVRVDLPFGRGPIPVSSPAVMSLTSYPADPGHTLGLKKADLTLNTPLAPAISVVGPSYPPPP